MAQQAENQPTTPAVESGASTERRQLEKRSAPGQIWYFLRRWPVIPLILMVTLVISGIFAPVIAPVNEIEQSLAFRNYGPTWGKATEFNVIPDPADYDMEITKERSAYNRAKKNSFPRKKYILGADQYGRDILSRVVWGARISLKVTVYALTSGIIIGSSLGLAAGFFGGWTDEILMRLVDVWNALPFILIALVIAQQFLHQGGAAEGVVIFLIALVAWTPFVRQVRADVLTIRGLDYVMAARTAGASNLRIIISTSYQGRSAQSSSLLPSVLAS